MKASWEAKEEGRNSAAPILVINIGVNVLHVINLATRAYPAQTIMQLPLLRLAATLTRNEGRTGQIKVTA